MNNQIQSTASAAGSQVAGAGKNIANAGWSAIPTQYKAVIFLVGGFFIYRAIKTAISNTRLDEDTRDSKQEVDGWYQSAVADNKKAQATMSTTQFKSLANKIWATMDGYGTRDYDLKGAFRQVQNDADFSGLSAAYGVRTLQPGWGSGWYISDFKGTMVQCIEDDASSSTMDDINKQLESRGIKYRV
tara:strand:+ start:403 stop:963 length:561 start_codon:yes stop_codon:yes gene_type:complete